MDYTKNRMVYIGINFIFSLISILMTVFLEESIDFWSESVIKDWIFVYGWIGIAIIAFIVLSWKNKTGLVFCPYTIFMAFFMVFNYGQFLMWALGIHYEGELGATKWIRYMDPATLLKIEMIVTTYLSFFHLGALVTPNTKNKVKKDIDFSTIRQIILIIMIASWAIEMYVAVLNLKVALTSGYTALYYGESVVQVNVLFKYISYMFFPSLIAYWISTNFSQKGFWTIMAFFAPYLVVNLLAGDRGNWLYFMLVLVWAYLMYINKFKIGTIIKLGVSAAVLLIVTSILVKYREIGFNNITLDNTQTVIADLSYTFVKPFFEMGQSARVLGILIQDNLYEKWEYGNTYIAGILAMILPRIKMWFGYPDFYLDNWISQDYLGLENYGVGFSITAEAYLNGGSMWGPFIMLIMGIFFGKLFNVSRENMYNMKHMFIVLTSAGCFLPLCRGSFEFMLRKWFWGCLVLWFIFAVFGRRGSKSQ